MLYSAVINDVQNTSHLGVKIQLQRVKYSQDLIEISACKRSRSLFTTTQAQQTLCPSMVTDCSGIRQTVLHFQVHSNDNQISALGAGGPSQLRGQKLSLSLNRG